MKILAFDLGASNGKIFLGNYDGATLALKQVKRFDNNQYVINDEIFWDILEVYHNLKEGVFNVLQSERGVISIGLDSYSNDFGLLDKDGRFVSQVHCYRDSRSKRNEEKIYSTISRQKLHSLCGNQNALFGTFMQLASMSLEKQSYLLEGAGNLLFLPDLFTYFLTGEINSEYTISSVSQMMDFNKTDWSREILDTFGIPEHIFPNIIHPGAQIGKLSKLSGCSVQKNPIEVVAVCEHDTASAFLAAPFGDNSVIISSGTWSLVGVETSSPIINDFTFLHNIANEGGYPGHHRILKNVMGQWIVQECRRFYFDQGRDYSFEQLMALATEEKPFNYMVNPDDERFFSPGRMPEKLREFCGETHQKSPGTPGEVMRCVVESLALQYRLVIEELEEVVGQKFNQINIVGGGSNNRLLNQCVANVTDRKVFSGPTEATALGNMIVQLITSGEIADVTQGRQIMMKSFPIDEYDPENQSEWEARFKQYCHMVNQKKDASQ
ncbi:MAG: rhamnulokinase [Chloroflexi bacterium]|nr:rhamnulokinase [Chloroflexota bacterium]